MHQSNNSAVTNQIVGKFRKSIMMIGACSTGDITAVISFLAAAAEDDNYDHGHGVVDSEENVRCNSRSNNDDEKNHLSRAQLLASQQDPTTGLSPLMIASQHGHVDICQVLLDAGAPWNAVDRNGKCAGDYATDMQHWDVVNLLVDMGTKAEVSQCCCDSQSGKGHVRSHRTQASLSLSQIRCLI